MPDCDAISGFKRLCSSTGDLQQVGSQLDKRQSDEGAPDEKQQVCCRDASDSVWSAPQMQFNPQASFPRAMPRPPLPDAPPAEEAPCGCLEVATFGNVTSENPSPGRELPPGRLAALRRIAGGRTIGSAERSLSDADQDMPQPHWTLGAGAVDEQLGAGGLAIDGLHEVKPALAETGGCHAGDWAAALAFGFRLALRRLSHGAERGEGAALLWCQPRQTTVELGRLYAPGLKHLGIDPARIIVVEPSRREEVLWAMEEGLASGAVALVAGIVDDIGLTPARRLSLRAERHHTPCLLLTSPHSAATAATATRWRIARCPGARHPFDARAPGALRLAVTLERCRQRPLLEAAVPFSLEWSDEAFCFDMASGLADRADGSRGRRRHAA